MGLKNIGIKDWRDLAPMEGWAKVVRVYDGDTFWLIVNPTDPLNLNVPNEQLRLVNVRLARVNAPELKGVSADEKEKGKQTRDYVDSLIGDKVVWFSFGNYGLYNGESLDCYHRQIGEITVMRPYNAATGKHAEWVGGSEQKLNLSDHLLRQGLAKPFVPK